MSKMWQGRTDGLTNKIADDFNSSIAFDSRMFQEDISGSIAHAKMLFKCGIITESELDEIVSGLCEILTDIKNGSLEIDETAEDIHMFIEAELTKKHPLSGKKLHTARSRNDQVALDLRLYLLKESENIKSLIKELIKALLTVAKDNTKTIMPGYTHLQRAQPIVFSHQLLSYCFMLLRDLDRLNNCDKRTAVSPIGSCALAGTTYNTDRDFEAELLGLSDVALNSIDGVSDRDFALEMLSDLSILMMHLSRLSEEIILWSSLEFNFIELSNEFTTGSSIMPQKKNSDMAELVRGKTGRVYGDLMALLTTLKGLPLAYNKDMQEDKEAIFDAIDTVKMCLQVYAPMVSGITVKKDNMLKAAQKGFINATDLADYLTKKGVPFRESYKISGQLVSYCIQNNKVLEELSLDEYKEFSDVFEEDLYGEIDLYNCVAKRISKGGVNEASQKEQIAFIEKAISL